MASSLDDEVAVPEKGVLVRPIKLDWRGLFKSVTRGTLAVGTADPTRSLGLIKDLGGHLVDTIASTELGREPDELAGGMLKRALIRAMGTLLADYWDRIRFDDQAITTALKRVGDYVDEGLQLIDVPLDDLLDRPREIAILPPFQRFLQRWLEACSLAEQNATTITARLPTYFLYALREEARNPQYSALFGYIDGRYAEAWRRERTWRAYRDWFRRDLQIPLFGESFSLEQMFLWPRAYYIEHAKSDERSSRRLHDFDESPPKAHSRHEHRHVVNLRMHLDRWMSTHDPSDTIRVISGDPGAGKSSFARMYAAHRMEQNDRVLFVPLHRLTNPSGATLHEIERFLEELDDAPKGALVGEHTEQTILLVLDGLDELSKQGTTGASIAKDFVEKTRTAVSSRNARELRLRVLLSGRPIAVQDIVNQVQEEKEPILHLLPLHLTVDEWRAPPESKGYEYVGDTELLVHDQRQDWWKRFGTFGRGEHDGMPGELNSPQFVELTQQPLLNYLVALVYEDFRAHGKVLDPSISRNEIYERLLRRMLDRERREGRAQRIRDLDHRTFARLLEEMALVGWHQGERVVSFEALESQCKDDQRLHRALTDFKESEGGRLTRLFTAFYFRRHGVQRGLHEHYEFTHKSFAEYLTARRMVGTLQTIDRRIQPTDDFDSDQWSHRHALLEWLKIFGPNPITLDLLPYLRAEVALREKAPRDRWQQTLVMLIGAALRQGMPCEQLGSGLAFREMAQQSRNAEEALLVMLDASAAITGARSKIDWPSPTAFGAWIKTLQRQRHDDNNVVTLHCLRRIDIRRQVALNLDLDGAILDGAILDGAKLDGAILNGARLYRTRLYGTSLDNARLNGANLDGASLSAASLYHASLHSATLNDARLDGALLYRANLRNAELNNARLPGAILDSAILDGANLSGAILDRARLDRASLNGAMISTEQIGVTQGNPAMLPDGKRSKKFAVDS